MIRNHSMKIRYENNRVKGDYEAISKFIKYEKYYYYSLIFLRQAHRNEHEGKKKIKKSSSCV